jgi:ferredoxin-thioredoxin reductase catalytic subunit
MTMEKIIIPEPLIEALYKKLGTEAEKSGYHLNSDIDFTRALVRSLLINEKRYSYQACPCRLATGKKEDDLDIICPCDYRDADLNDFGSCFCALYVTKDVLEGKKKLGSIPERRPILSERNKIELESESGKKEGGNIMAELKMPVWRCKVCGYLCARDAPPDECPICKVTKDRFERFM